VGLRDVGCLALEDGVARVVEPVFDAEDVAGGDGGLGAERGVLDQKIVWCGISIIPFESIFS
jgi:hypothetical protein